MRAVAEPLTGGRELLIGRPTRTRTILARRMGELRQRLPRPAQHRPPADVPGMSQPVDRRMIFFWAYCGVVLKTSPDTCDREPLKSGFFFNVLTNSSSGVDLNQKVDRTSRARIHLRNRHLSEDVAMTRIDARCPRWAPMPLSIICAYGAGALAQDSIAVTMLSAVSRKHTSRVLASCHSRPTTCGVSRRHIHRQRELANPSTTISNAHKRRHT